MAVYVARKDATLDKAKGVWYMKGAIEVVLRHSVAMAPNGDPLTLKDKAHFEGVAAEIGKLGLRGNVYSRIHVNVLLVFCPRN